MSAPTNPPAFPIDAHVETQGPYADRYMGMSLRDWFAGQALIEVAGLITFTKPETYKVVAELAYNIADAMLAERTPTAAATLARSREEA